MLQAFIFKVKRFAIGSEIFLSSFFKLKTRSCGTPMAAGFLHVLYCKIFFKIIFIIGVTRIVRNALPF